jgi:peptidoglycan/xylan/chitin deacetylase (PgdA/CDA1 family)
MALTFDDGFEDNYEVAFPILEKKRLSATFNVPTDFINTGLPQWDWEVVCRLSGREINKVDVGGVSLCRTSSETSVSFALRVIDYLKAADVDVLQRVLDDLRERSREVVLGSKCMSWKQVRTLWKAGMEIGSHGATHRSLAQINPAEAFDEIRRSKEVLDSQTDDSCEHFAFPFGSRHDYNQTLIDAVRQAGFRTCLLNVWGYNHVSQVGFGFKRISVTETSNLRYFV